MADNLLATEYGSNTPIYTYDENGNRISEIYQGAFDHNTNTYDSYGTEYEWDHRNRLVAIISTSPNDPHDFQTWRYELAYDAFNRLVKTTTVPASGTGSGQQTVDRFYAGFDESDNPTLYFSGNGATDLETRYLWSGDQIVAVEDLRSNYPSRDHSIVNWALTDHLGTVRDVARLADATNRYELTLHVEYSPFGEAIDGFSAANDNAMPFGFTGQLSFGFFGLTYHHNRWYDASIGRWISKDPIGFAAGDVNLNRYVGNNPLNYNDPSGLMAAALQLDGDGDQGGGNADKYNDDRAWWWPGNWPGFVGEAIFGNEEESREMMFGNGLNDQRRVIDDITLNKDKISNPVRFIADTRRGTPLTHESIEQLAKANFDH